MLSSAMRSDTICLRTVLLWVIQMKFKAILLIAFLLPIHVLAQPWSPPQVLAGLGSGQSFVDPNGNLFIVQTGRANLAVASERPLTQLLKSDDTFGEPIPYPLFPTSSGISQKGVPAGIIQDLDGNRMVIWSIGGAFGGAPVMTYQRADGSYGPNSVSLGGDGSFAFRDGLVIGLFQSPNGQVLVKEWTVGSDGTISPRPAIPPLVTIDALFGGCGAGIGINPDGSAEAIFQSDLQIKTATRNSSGTWTVGTAPIDQVVQNVESMGCLSARSSPAGRIVAAWWNTQVGDGANFDRGGSVRALVREPGSAMPKTFVTMLSNPPSGQHSRRDNGLSVAMGLDGTAGVLAYTTYCADKDNFFSQGILRLASPGQDFATAARTVGIGAMDSGKDKIWANITNHTPATAFAVENRKAVFGVHAVAYPNVGTSLRPSCGPGQQITEPQTYSSTAVYYDAGADKFTTQEIQSFIGEPGKFNEFRRLIDAAIDFSGNAALVRAPLFMQNSDVLLLGDWESGKGLNPPENPTVTPTPTQNPTNSPTLTPTAVPTSPPTPEPTVPAVSFADDVRAKINRALLLITSARKPLPTAKTSKAKATKAAIVAARKELNGIIAILIGLLKTESASISAVSLKNFSDKNLKGIKAGIKAGTSLRLTKQQQAAGWTKARKLLSQLAA